MSNGRNSSRRGAENAEGKKKNNHGEHGVTRREEKEKRFYPLFLSSPSVSSVVKFFYSKSLTC